MKSQIRINHLMRRNKVEMAKLLFSIIQKLDEKSRNQIMRKINDECRHKCEQPEEEIPCQPIMLKVAYNGQYLSGVQECDSPFTIVGMLKEALKISQMIPENINVPITSCGRTDSGVSASGQTFSLWIRSPKATGATFGDQSGFQQHHKTIDYINAINPKLPAEIQITHWAFIQPDFSARRSTTGRTYSYFIPFSQNINIEMMTIASQKLIGQKNFQNFCYQKEGITNYVRKIHSFDFIIDENILQIRIKGTAFLYHQIRCIIAILILIGLQIENYDVIDYLLDTEKVKSRPNYLIAPPEFLLFENPLYDNIEWITTTKDKFEKIKLNQYDNAIFWTYFSSIQEEVTYNYIIDQIRGNKEQYIKIQNIQ